VLKNRGGPGRPLSFDELGTKFQDNAGRVITAEEVSRIESTVARMAELRDISPLLVAEFS